MIEKQLNFSAKSKNAGWVRCTDGRTQKKEFTKLGAYLGVSKLSG